MLRNLFIAFVLVSGFAVYAAPPLTIKEATQKEVLKKDVDAATLYEEFNDNRDGDYIEYLGKKYNLDQKWSGTHFTIRGSLSHVERSQHEGEDVHVFLHTGDVEGIMLSVPAKAYDAAEVYQDAIVRAHVWHFEGLFMSTEMINGGKNVMLKINVDSFEVLPEE